MDLFPEHEEAGRVWGSEGKSEGPELWLCMQRDVLGGGAWRRLCGEEAATCCALEETVTGVLGAV